MRVVNRFSWHKNPGDFAEKYLRQKYIKGLGLSFRKIRKDKIGRKPDGYILDSKGKKIALAEIKLVKYQRRSPGIQRITLDETIQRSIRSSKRQLRNINTGLPKIIYLIRDDPFMKPGTLRWAIFGKEVMMVRGGRTIFSGYSGLHPRYKEDDKFRDDTIAAVICYIPMLKDYCLWIYRNKNAQPIPAKLLDKSHIEELWDYNSKGLKRIM